MTVKELKCHLENFNDDAVVYMRTAQAGTPEQTLEIGLGDSMEIQHTAQNETWIPFPKNNKMVEHNKILLYNGDLA